MQKKILKRYKKFLYGYWHLVELICCKGENDVLIEKRAAHFNNEDDIPEDLNAVNGGELYGFVRLNGKKLEDNSYGFTKEEYGIIYNEIGWGFLGNAPLDILYSFPTLVDNLANGNIKTARELSTFILKDILRIDDLNGFDLDNISQKLVSLNFHFLRPAIRFAEHIHHLLNTDDFKYIPIMTGWKYASPDTKERLMQNTFTYCCRYLPIKFDYRWSEQKMKDICEEGKKVSEEFWAEIEREGIRLWRKPPEPSR